jgi:hypothetical protein
MDIIICRLGKLYSLSNLHYNNADQLGNPVIRLLFTQPFLTKPTITNITSQILTPHPSLA